MDAKEQKKTTLVSIFSSPEKKTKEELEKENKEQQEKYNPFLLGPKNKKKVPGFGYAIDPKYGANGALRIVLDLMGESVEKYYFHFQKFFTRHMDSQYGMYAEGGVLKLKDMFDASVTSSFHGHVGTKISAIQQQVSTYLTQIGQLSKTLFPMVREIRLMDERLEMYRNSLSENPEDEKARQNEVALKSMWIEVVEQGIQNPNSIYSMATKLGFVTLPDLFFSTNPYGKTPEEQAERLSRVLGAMQKQHAFNLKVRNALEKKLVQYYTWKAKTYREMHYTWKFRLKNLKQHYNVIRLYSSWIRPYLTSLKALQMEGGIHDPELISAFETSKLELELLAIIKKGKHKTIYGNVYNSCILIRMTYVTRPDLFYTQGNQKQPIHAGTVYISIESYIATDADIAYYQKRTDKESLTSVSGESIDMVADVDQMLTSLGEDVEEYLREAETGQRKEEKKEEGKKGKRESVFAPFQGLGEGFKEMFGIASGGKKQKKEGLALDLEKKELESVAKAKAWVTYDVFKKVYGLFSF